MKFGPPKLSVTNGQKCPLLLLQEEKLRYTYEDCINSKVKMVGNLTQEMVEENELRQKLKQAILLLPKQRKTVFFLAKIEGWSSEKIAKALGVSECPVKVTLQTAVRDVQTFMDVTTHKRRQRKKFENNRCSQQCIGSSQLNY